MAFGAAENAFYHVHTEHNKLVTLNGIEYYHLPTTIPPQAPNHEHVTERFFSLRTFLVLQQGIPACRHALKILDLLVGSLRRDHQLQPLAPTTLLYT